MQDRAILDLKLARDKLKQYQRKMEDESNLLLARAQACHKAGDKRKAVYYMKVKKLKEQKVNDLFGELLGLEKMINTIEWATQNALVFEAMGRAQAALESAQAALPIEAVDELLLDVAEGIENQQAIDDTLSGRVGVPLGPALDEDALEAELAQMEREMTPGAAPPLPAPPAEEKTVAATAAALPAPPAIPIFPAPPSTEEAAAAGPSAIAESTEEDDELDRELAMSAA